MSEHSKDPRQLDQTDVLTSTSSTMVAIRPQDAHKQNPRNLWLTNAVTDRPDGWVAAFEIPETTGRIRVADLFEVQRQAGIVFAHRCLNVASDAVFVLGELSMSGISECEWRAEKRLSGEVTVSAADHRSGSRLIRKASMRFNLSGPRGRLAQGTANVKFLSPALYERLRSRSVVGVGSTDTAQPQVPDLSGGPDPLVGDHPTDHVPAMAVAVAIEEAILREARGRNVTSLSLRFEEYIEHHPRFSLAVEGFRSGILHGRVYHGGMPRTVFSATLS